MLLFTVLYIWSDFCRSKWYGSGLKKYMGSDIVVAVVCVCGFFLSFFFLRLRPNYKYFKSTSFESLVSFLTILICFCFTLISSFVYNET